MRKLKFAGVAVLLALAATGVAVAHEGAKTDTDSVAATFTAERVALSEKTCAGGDGMYRVAREEFRGTVTSTDPRLSGNVVLRTRSFINQTTGLGTTRGEAIVRDADGKRKGSARLIAVNTEKGILEGVLIGDVKAAADKARGELVANLHAQFSSATTLAGTLGTSGAGVNTAVVQGGHCEKPEAVKREDDKKRGEHRGDIKAKLKVVKGEITALSATSLSVKVGDASVSFTLNELLSKYVASLGLDVGTKVEIAYAVKDDDKAVLLKVRKAQ
jgi:hypothetical protein